MCVCYHDSNTHFRPLPAGDVLPVRPDALAARGWWLAKRCICVCV